MKFMRLGTRPDFFSTRGNVTSVRSDLMSDIVLDVDGHKFNLHLFPLLARCGALHKLVTAAVEAGEDEVKIEEFPGSAECFEICAKFCYGVTITLNAHNVGEARCGAEYLKMSENVEKSNLVYKLEVFLNSSILRGWKDSIICLQSSKDCQPWCEDLNIINRCIESISSKMVVDPAKVDWSFSYSRVSIALDHVSVSQPNSPALWSGVQGCPWLSPVPKDWWVEDICDLDTDLFWRVMVTAKAKGVANDLVAEALKVYAQRWLPGVSDEHTMADSTRGTRLSVQVDYALEAKKHRQMLEAIVSLLPAEKGSSTCSFLLKLLKAAAILNASPTSKEELARRVGLQLEEASVRDLLIPSLAYVNEMHDVDVVIQMVEHYLLQNQSPPTTPPPERLKAIPDRRRTRSTENFQSLESRQSTAITHGSKHKVAKLIDSYLAEIARDPNLSVAKFLQLAESIPDFARPFHDGLYRAIDMYLKEHPNLPKGDRKKICRLMDCRKLSMDACMHAAQNERLPLRTVVQVLFFEQARTAATGGYVLSDMPSSIRALVGQESGDDRSQMSDMHTDNVPSVSASGEHGCYVLHQDFSTLKEELTHLKSRIADAETRQSFAQDSLKPAKSKGIFSKPKKFLQKLFSKKVSNSASSKDSDTQSTEQPAAGEPVNSSLRQRHSMV